MHIVDGSTFTVASQEHVTVDIQKTTAPSLATVSGLIGAAWAPKPAPAGLVAQGAFDAPLAANSIVTFTVVFDFVPDATGSFLPGDEYVVTICGRPTEPTRVETVGPPPPQTRTYLFTVV